MHDIKDDSKEGVVRTEFIVQCGMPGYTKKTSKKRGPLQFRGRDDNEKDTSCRNVHYA